MYFLPHDSPSYAARAAGASAGAETKVDSSAPYFDFESRFPGNRAGVGLLKPSASTKRARHPHVCESLLPRSSRNHGYVGGPASADNWITMLLHGSCSIDRV